MIVIINNIIYHIFVIYRIERVEAGLSADRAGLRPGDYIIFVDKHNVVTMPEEEILSLIRYVVCEILI